MSEEPTFDLNRENNIERLVDATGKLWKIHVNRQNGLCHVRPEPDREDAVIPKELAGQWTKPSLIRPKIVDYVTKSWDHAEKVRIESERKTQAALEYQARKAKLADKDSDGAEND